MIEQEINVIVNGKGATYKLTDEEAKFKFIGGLESGVWYINTLNNGFVATVIADKIADIPAVMTKASFEPKKDRIAKLISKLLASKKIEETLPTTREVMQAISKGIGS